MKSHIRGNKYDIKRASLKNDWGVCTDPSAPDRKILINRELKDESEKLLVIVLHEMLHAGLFDLDESVVDELSKDIGKVLYKMGARISLK